jgi:hypothetical protein
MRRTRVFVDPAEQRRAARARARRRAADDQTSHPSSDAGDLPSARAAVEAADRFLRRLEQA